MHLRTEASVTDKCGCTTLIKEVPSLMVVIIDEKRGL